MGCFLEHKSIKKVGFLFVFVFPWNRKNDKNVIKGLIKLADSCLGL